MDMKKLTSQVIMGRMLKWEAAIVKCKKITGKIQGIFKKRKQNPEEEFGHLCLWWHLAFTYNREP